jgi:hypothetical protein
MKKILLISGMIALILLGGCSKDKDNQPAGPDNKVMIEEIFKAGMAWDDAARALKSTYPVNIDVETYQYGIEGGYIHVLGSVTGNMTIDDNTGQVTGGVLLLGVTESVVNYTFESGAEIYTMNGAPYLSLAGTFTLMPGNTYATASTMSIGGGVRVTGPNGYDQTVNLQLSILIYADGSGGRVSGTINGEGVDYTIGG